MMWGWSDWGWQAWLAMSVMMLVVWAAIVWAIIAIARSASGKHRGSDEILAERFARGDIDEAEYQRRRELIRGAP